MCHMGTPLPEVQKQMQHQHGVITRNQLRGLGISEKQIYRLCKRGDLIRLYPGTFRSGAAPLTWESRLFAAVASQGNLAAAAMRAAGRLHNLDGCSSNVLEVVRCGPRRRRAKVIVHETDWLPRSHISQVKGIFTTNVHRTLVDLGAVVSSDALEIAAESAIRMGKTSHDYLQGQLDDFRGRGRRGCQALQHVLDLRKGLRPTESIFETKLFQVLRDGGLPLPRRQIPVYENGNFVGRPDFLYPDARVAIEALSKKHHSNPTARSRDADRFKRLEAAGYTVIEVTWIEMVDHPTQVVASVAEALGMRLF